MVRILDVTWDSRMRFQFKKRRNNDTCIVSGHILHGLYLGGGVEDVEGANVELMLPITLHYVILKYSFMYTR